MTTMTTAFPFYNARGLNAETAHGFISSVSIWTQNVYQRCGTAVRSADRHCHPTASASVLRRRVSFTVYDIKCSSTCAFGKLCSNTGTSLYSQLFFI